jgi:hypothetical protein
VIRGDCHVCAKPLNQQAGPVLMDREGHRYHLLCWRDMIDGQVQDNRKAIDRHRVTIRQVKEKLTPRSDDDQDSASGGKPA